MKHISISFILLLFFSFSCQEKQKNYNDFSFEFRDVEDEYIFLSQKSIDEMLNNGKSVNFSEYKSIFEKSGIDVKTEFGTENYSLGRLKNISFDKNFEIYLIQCDEVLNLIIYDKLRKRFSEIFKSPNSLKPDYVRLARNKYHGKNTFLCYNKFKLDTWNGFNKEVKFWSDIEYKLNKNGRFEFYDSEFNDTETFRELPFLGAISGEYSINTKLQRHGIQLIIKDIPQNNSFLYTLKIRDKQSGCMYNSSVKELILKENKHANSKEENGLEIKFDFSNEDKVKLYFDDCSESECQGGFCKIDVTLNKLNTATNKG